MSDVKHTPGPWVTVRDNGILLGGKQCRVVFGSTLDVAYVLPFDGDNGNANARLISAAPELLAACKTAVDAMAQEFLYQTGQTVRPERNYPQPGSVCGALGDAMRLLKEVTTRAEG